MKEYCCPKCIRKAYGRGWAKDRVIKDAGWIVQWDDKKHKCEKCGNEVYAIFVREVRDGEEKE